MRNVNVLFSKVLYVTNLRTVRHDQLQNLKSLPPMHPHDQTSEMVCSCLQNNSSQQQLRGLFEHFGRIAEVTVPINKATNSTKGFAFVAFANGLAADRCVAYGRLCKK